MAHCNNICIRFINYIAVLMLLFTSSAFAYEGDGGSFGGGGASGSWGGDKCEPQKKWAAHYDMNDLFDSPQDACAALGTRYPYMHGFSYRSGTCYGIYNSSGSESGLTTPVQKDNPKFDPSCQCKENEEFVDGKCVPICKPDETLINGQCKPKTCPFGQVMIGGICKSQQCPSGQTLVNGRCSPDPDKPDTPDPDPNEPFKLPPFCEWAAEMCQWHKEWQQWSNDYAANEEKANLDREELKRLALDSKEYLSDIKTNTTVTNQKLDALKIPLDQIKDQDKQFYDEVRLWLKNFDTNNGTPSEQNPSIQFPKFCDWSVQMCNWYLDWKDWRTDYKANNEFIKQKLDEHLARLKEIKEQDQEHYKESKNFFDDVRDFFDWYKDQANNPDDPNDPTNPNNDNGNVDVQDQQVPIDDSKKINFVESCPSGEQFTVSFMGQTQNLEFSYQPLCQFMSMIRPFVIAIAYLIGAYILMGLSRGSSE